MVDTELRCELDGRIQADGKILHGANEGQSLSLAAEYFIETGSGEGGIGEDLVYDQATEQLKQLSLVSVSFGGTGSGLKDLVNRILVDGGRTSPLKRIEGFQVRSGSCVDNLPAVGTTCRCT